MNILLPQLIFISMFSFAQNLVPNPGFEQYHQLPDKNNNGIQKTRDWIPPKYGSDYYHQLALGSDQK